MVVPISPTLLTSRFSFQKPLLPDPKFQEESSDISQFKIWFLQLGDPPAQLDSLAAYPRTLVRFLAEEPDYRFMSPSIFVHFNYAQACDFYTQAHLSRLSALLPSLEDFIDKYPIDRHRVKMQNIDYWKSFTSFNINSKEDILNHVLPRIQKIRRGLGHHFSPITFKAEQEAQEFYRKLFLLSDIEWNSDAPLKPKLIKQNQAHERCSYVYGNGMTDEINESGIGKRIYADGKQVIGQFDYELLFDTKDLMAGYQINPDATFSYFYPPSLFSACKLNLCDIEGILKFIDISCRPNKEIRGDFVDLLISMCKSSVENQSLLAVFKHPIFSLHRDKFYIEAFKHLFDFSSDLIGEILTNAPQKYIDQLNSDDCEELFRLTESSHVLSAALAKIYPDIFKLVASKLLLNCIQNNEEPEVIQQKINDLNTSKAELTPFLQLLFAATKQERLTENQQAALQSLSNPEKQQIYSAAFSYLNPYISEPLDYPVLGSAYSINLMWINEKLIDSQEYLLKDMSKLTDPALEWARYHPSSQVNLWYDSQTTTEIALENTKKILLASKDESKEYAQINFEDVRRLTLVQKNQHIFESCHNVYYRADLLRLIASVEAHALKYFVYADLDVIPLKNHELFDTRTVKSLENYGFILPKKGTGLTDRRYENSFHIINLEHIDFTSHLRATVINDSLKVNLDMIKKCCDSKWLAQAVFFQYGQMLESYQEIDPTFKTEYILKPILMPPSQFEVVVTSAAELFYPEF